MNLNNNKKEELGFFRKFLFPIHSNEILKFLLITLILSSALFCFTSLRILKDSLISNAPGSSSEAFNVLKFIGLGTAVLLTITFTSFTKNKSTAETFIYAFLSYIVIYFALGIIAPYAHYLQASPEVINDRIMRYPAFRFPIAVQGNWVYSMIYLFIEYCGNFLITYMFWQAANSLTHDNDRKRMYPSYGQWGNLIGIIAASHISCIEQFLYGGFLNSIIDPNIKTMMQVRYRLFIGVASLIFSVICYLIVINYLVSAETKASLFKRPDLASEKAAQEKAEAKAKKKFETKSAPDNIFGQISRYISYLLSLIFSPIVSTYNIIDNSRFWPILIPLKPFVKIVSSINENLSEVYKSPLLLAAGICVLAYGMSVNIVEALWKRYIRDQHTGFNASGHYYEGTYFRLGLASAVFGLIGGQISVRLPWFWLAIFTPVVMFGTGIIFLIAVIGDCWNVSIIDNFFTNLSIYYGYTSKKELIIFIGQLQNIFSKALKYIFFDSSMQMLYPYVANLTGADPKKAKGMIDASFGRLGKSGASTIQMILFSLVSCFSDSEGNIYSILPITSLIFIIICIIWIISVFKIAYLRTDQKSA